MNAHDVLRSMFSRLPSRQLRRSHERRIRCVLQRDRSRLAPESLEARTMLTAAMPNYQLVQDWGTGFQAGITLDNKGTTAVTDWKVSFDYSPQISSIWDAKIVSHVGSTYTIANAGWNGTLDPGRSVAFGFIGAGTGAAAPLNWMINGEPVGGALTPPLPELTVTGGSVTEGAVGGAAQAVFALSLSAPSSVPVTVAYRTVDGTATAGSDYAGASGTVTFAAGTTRQEVRVAVTGDANVEPDETFSLVLSSPQGCTLKSASANATIVNDDVAMLPQMSVTGTTVTEGGVGGTAQAVFALSISSPLSVPVTVAYRTADGTATAGSDYAAASGTVTFPAGSTRQEVRVAVTGDAIAESSETFSLVLSSPLNATLVQASASATIVDDDSAPSPGEKNIQTFDKVLSAYFPEWGIYGRNVQVADVPGDKLNHLIYAFLDLKSDGTVAITDSYASLEKRFTADESVSGEADLWSYPAGDPRATQTVWGNFNQLAELKVKYPHMKVSIAVGGWTLSDNFSSVCSTSAGREAFATSLAKFLDTYRMFDGIDFDWEYPSGGGEAGNSASPNDGVNYAALLQLVRQKFDALGSQLGRRYEISVASPAGYDKIANFNLPGLAKSVDYFNVMAYDFHGTWESTTGHQAAFTGDSKGYDVKTAVELYLAAGVPARKVVLGAPLYTRAWSGVADGGDGGFMETASGAAPGTFEKGVYDYKDLLAKVQDPSSGWKLYWDDNAQATYAYNKAQGLYSSFETPTSIAQRAQWAEDIGLGGMMFWDITGDAIGSKESLVGAAFSSWVLDEDLATIRSKSGLTNELVIGGDGVITALPPVA